MDYEPVIGLEIHVQLKTASKMFCSCRNVSGEAEPNSAICSICTGQPGTLPAVNQQALVFGLQAALALQMQINTTVRFDRKNYFYPDLPKGYQITQFFLPVGLNGSLEFYADGVRAVANIQRAHLEEDSAKLIHRGDATLVDFNRAGEPLLEIVTAPDFRTPAMAHAFLDELKLTLRTLKVSDADMEKGQLRVDANVSLRPMGETKLSPKTEVKNINSFRGLERALQREIERQRALWELGTPPTAASTRGWDEGKGETVERREKEGAADYRYFPEPDLPPITYTPEDIERTKHHLPELPMARRKRFIEMYGFAPADANLLVLDSRLAEYAEQIISELKDWLRAENPKARGATWQIHHQELAKLIANWLIHRFVPLTLAAKQAIPGKVTAENFAEFLTYIFGEEINATTAQQVLEEMVRTGADPSHIIDERGLRQVRDAKAINDAIRAVIQQFPEQVAQYKKGKTGVLQFLIGKVMAGTKGKADPKAVADELLHRFK